MEDMHWIRSGDSYAPRVLAQPDQLRIHVSLLHRTVEGGPASQTDWMVRGLGRKRLLKMMQEGRGTTGVVGCAKVSDWRSSAILQRRSAEPGVHVRIRPLLQDPSNTPNARSCNGADAGGSKMRFRLKTRPSMLLTLPPWVQPCPCCGRPLSGSEPG